MKIFQRGHLPNEDEFREYRKTQTTKALRIEGPFRTVTREGIIETPNGWLAIDSNGWPYPIADDVFQASYEAVPEEE